MKMQHKNLMRSVGIGLVALFWLTASAQETHPTPKMSPERVQQIAAMLPAEPAGFGPPCSDRVAWRSASSRYDSSVGAAQELIKSPIPPWVDNDYLEFSRKGTRPKGEAMLRARDGQLSTLVLAECSDWRGRFLPRIAEQLDVISGQKSWTLPAHDGKLENFDGTRYFVELNSAALGHVVAETLYLLGDKLPADTRKRAMDALNLRIFEPTRRLIAGKDHEFWLDAASNWNAVCWNGVASAALTVLPSIQERAYFAAAAELYSEGYLRSYTPSGYAEEGIGYWGYGFDAYEDLREQLWLSTKGKVDLYNNEQARKAALFPFQFQMLPNVYADFADARFGTKPDAYLMARIDYIFNLGLHTAPEATNLTGNLPDAILKVFPLPSRVTQQQGPVGYDALIGLHTYYPDAGVLVDRPGAGGRLAITIKAGGNGGHSHNDIGSYAIGLNGTQPVGDPGGPLAYNATTFSSTRFQSKLLNSFGHPVPEIDGVLQLDATKVSAAVLSTSFSPEKDQIAIDLSHAYSNDKLTGLVRTMTYRRGGRGSVDIQDSFRLAGPVEVEESFPTHGSVRQVDANTLVFDYQGAHLKVTIAGPAAFTLTKEDVNEYGDPFLRVGVRIHFTTSASVLMHFSEDD